MKTDIQIARECQLVHINEIATQLGINPEEIDPYGRYMAKVPVKLIDEEKVKKSRLILVTAISPTTTSFDSVRTVIVFSCPT